MISKLIGAVLLLTTLSWSSVLCPKDIRTKVEAAVTTEPITQGENLRGFRVFIKNNVDGAEIRVPLTRTKATWATTWSNYLELLYILRENTLPRESFPVKVLSGGRTYICTVKIYYSFYGGLVKEVE